MKIEKTTMIFFKKIEKLKIEKPEGNAENEKRNENETQTKRKRNENEMKNEIHTCAMRFRVAALASGAATGWS